MKKFKPKVFKLAYKTEEEKLYYHYLINEEPRNKQFVDLLYNNSVIIIPELINLKYIFSLITTISGPHSYICIMNGFIQTFDKLENTPEVSIFKNKLNLLEEDYYEFEDDEKASFNLDIELNYLIKNNKTYLTIYNYLLTKIDYYAPTKNELSFNDFKDTIKLK